MPNSKSVVYFLMLGAILCLVGACPRDGRLPSMLVVIRSFYVSITFPSGRFWWEFVLVSYSCVILTDLDCTV